MLSETQGKVAEGAEVKESKEMLIGRMITFMLMVLMGLSLTLPLDAMPAEEIKGTIWIVGGILVWWAQGKS